MRPKGFCLSMALGLIAFGGGSYSAPFGPSLPGPPGRPGGLGDLVAVDSFDGRVRIHDAKTGALLRAIDAGCGRGVAFAPDGRSLACAGYHMDKLVDIFDVRSGKRLRKLAGHTEIEAALKRPLRKPVSPQ